MPRKKKVYNVKDGEKLYATGYASVIEEKKAPSDAVRFLFWAIGIAVVTAVIIWLITTFGAKAQATTNPCQIFCADQRIWGCADWDYRLCHVNPSQSVTHNFNNLTSCENHLGTPHNNETYDTYGACPVVSPTVTPTQTPTATPTQTPTETPTPTPTDVPEKCEQESWSCGECQSEPPDNICYDNFKGYCGEEYGCKWTEECELNGLTEKTLIEPACRKVWKCETSCEVEPTPTPTPEPKREESKPSGCTGDCSAPAPTCGSANTTKEPANFHVYRNGDTALLKWWATEGNKVHAYWKLVGSNEWQHSLTADNTGYLEIGALGNADWTFGLQQVNDCGGGTIYAGNILSVVDGNTHHWILFR